MNIIDRDTAKVFLNACKARQVATAENDTSRVVMYEIDRLVDGEEITETWTERESKLEEPEYYYELKRKS